jgi:hypothetical protein
VAESEIILYEHRKRPSPETAARNTGEALAEQNRWSFGLPYAEALPDATAIVVYYADGEKSLSIHCAKLLT